jgi:hypothetical protein
MKYLHNSFIIHGIKYNILNESNQTIERDQKLNSECQISKILIKNTIFQNPIGSTLTTSIPENTRTKHFYIHATKIHINIDIINSSYDFDYANHLINIIKYSLITCL